MDAMTERYPAAHRGLQLIIGQELARKLAATNRELVREHSECAEEKKRSARNLLLGVSEPSQSQSVSQSPSGEPTPGARSRSTMRRATLATCTSAIPSMLHEPTARAIDAAVLPQSCV